MNRFNKIITLSKQIASALLKNERPVALERSEDFGDEDKKHIIKGLTDDVEIKERSKLSDQIDSAADWKKVRSQIDVPIRKMNWRYAAAAVVTGVLISGYFFKDKFSINHEPESTIESNVVDTHIKIGTDKATLTLEDGSEVVLNKGTSYHSQNAESNGEALVYRDKDEKPNEIAYNYLTIPRGGQFFVELSDGTKVWLNSDSRIKYPVQFIKGETRIVELIYGEAYFDVSSTSNTNHNGAKFKVITNTQEIEVLGTEFNVKAYLDEDLIYTTLVEGSIALNGFHDRTFLKPKEQAMLNKKSNSLTVSSQVDVNSEVAWKRGLFSFRDKSLKEIMKVLSRWYDVDVVFEDKELEKIQFKGVLSKNQNITEILLLIKNTNYINNYDIKQKTIILKN